MSLSTLKPVSCRLSPAAGQNGFHSNPSNQTMANKPVAVSPLQVRRHETKTSVKETCAAASRREMMQLTAASLGFLSLLLPEAAEARPRNADMRKKILDKLGGLREKAGLSKPKTDEKQEKISKQKDEEEHKLKAKDQGGEKLKTKDEKEEKKPKPKEEGEVKKPTPEEGTSIFSLPNILNGESDETPL